MADPKQMNHSTEQENEVLDNERKELSKTWPDDALADLADYIEEQGVYIRQ